MAAKPLRVESRGLDVDGVHREIVGKASSDRSEPFRDAETEGELLVVTRCSHGHGDGLTADPYLERLLDRNAIVGAVAAGQPDGADRPSEMWWSASRATLRHLVSVLPRVHRLVRPL